MYTRRDHGLRRERSMLFHSNHARVHTISCGYYMLARFNSLSLSMTLLSIHSFLIIISSLFDSSSCGAFFVSVAVHSAMLFIDRRLTSVAKSKLRRKNVRNAGMLKLGTQFSMQFISLVIACKFNSILWLCSHALWVFRPASI